MSSLIGKFTAGDGFTAIIERLEEAMDISINISMRVQDYRDHIAFANYIAHLQTADVQALSVGDKYQANIDKLNLEIQKSIVQEAYIRIVNAVRQWAFPFADQFLSAIPTLDQTDYPIMEQNLNHILRQLVTYKASVHSIDQAITESTFSDTATQSPFYSWPYEKYPRKIIALLKGETVVLNAKVMESPLNAVKFNRIGIEIHCKLGDQDVELNHALISGFKISLGHNGIMDYKYMGQYYQTSTDKPFKISYSFKFAADGVTPEERSNSWNKLVNGDVLLSPYTSWTIKIEKLPITKTHIDLFEKFKNVIHLMKIDLVGQGSYVDTEKAPKALHLNKYYSKVKNVTFFPKQLPSLPNTDKYESLNPEGRQDSSQPHKQSTTTVETQNVGSESSQTTSLTNSFVQYVSKSLPKALARHVDMDTATTLVETAIGAAASTLFKN